MGEPASAVCNVLGVACDTVLPTHITAHSTQAGYAIVGENLATFPIRVEVDARQSCNPMSIFCRPTMPCRDILPNHDAAMALHQRACSSRVLQQPA